MLPTTATTIADPLSLIYLIYLILSLISYLLFILFHPPQGAVLDEGEDEWDLREGCSVQSGACVGGI